MSNLHIKNAKVNKNDEFYTQYKDIEDELLYYSDIFKDKIVYCNCDSIYSNFYLYFKNNYTKLGLRGLLQSSNDFRDIDNINLLKKCDIVVTNPPFSIIKDFINLLSSYNKDFLIITSMQSIGSTFIYNRIINNTIRLGINCNKSLSFIIPDYYTKYSKIIDNVKYANVSISWITTLPHNIEKPFIILTKEYNNIDYPKYDNYNAIEVNKTNNIPKDYYGVMGVPISFLNKYNNKQFQLVNANDYIIGKPKGELTGKCLLDNKNIYKRVFIKPVNSF